MRRRLIGHLAGGFVLLRHSPLTFSNTGRMCLDRREIRCTASTKPAASRCSASIFFGNFVGGRSGSAPRAPYLGGDHGEAAPGGAGPRRFDGGVSASSVVCLAIARSG